MTNRIDQVRHVVERAGSALPTTSALPDALTTFGRARRPATSVWSYRSPFSLLSAFSVGSLLSFGSVLSIGSAGSVLSIGSSGSILSIGSAGSILSIGGAGTILGIGSVGVAHRKPPVSSRADDAPDGLP